MLTKSQTREDKFDEIVQLRASLGVWKLNETVINIETREGVTPQMDLRVYKVTEVRGAYKKPIVYNITSKDLSAKIKTLQHMTYRLVTPQFPELQTYFRNGKPVTAIDIFEDAIDSIEVVVDNRTGIQALLDSWK